MVNDNQLESALTFFKELQLKLSKGFEQVDGKAKGEFKDWQRSEGGGGRMWTIRGSVVEKAGANFSHVFGSKYPAIEGEYKDKPFSAMGVSTITHMLNPYAPIGHMNVRLLQVGEGKDKEFWFGGGGDLTPFKPFEEDTREFHEELKMVCDRFAPDAYLRYSKWCDEYFYIQHRNSPRGVGGIFFDYLKGDFDKVFEFVKGVGHAYTDAFLRILNRRKNHPYTEQEKIDQEYWRGRYVEYNLLYDRGTRFGLMSGGNIEAIFVSLPPTVRW